MPTATDWILAGAAVLSLIVSLFATRSAARSATASEKSAQSATDLAHREAIREVALASQHIANLGARVDLLSTQLRAEHQAYCRVTGNIGASAVTLFNEKIDERLAKFVPIRAEAASVGNDYSQLSSASNDDLETKRIKFNATVEALRGLHGELEREMATIVARREAYVQRSLRSP